LQSARFPLGDPYRRGRRVLSRFFISYTKQDEAWAEWIAFILEDAGHEVVIQAWDFRPGSDFVVQMDRALKDCDHVLAVLSEAYLQSSFATAEWSAAFAQDPTGEKGYLIPVRVEEVAQTGLLRARIRIDLVGLCASETKEALLTGVGEQRAKPTAVPFPGCVRPSRSTPPFPGAPTSTPHVLPATTLPEADVLARAVALLASSRSSSSGMLHIAVATDAAQRLMRPSDFDGEILAASLQQQALFGARVLDVGEGVQVKREATGMLTLEQRDARVVVDERGTVVVTLPAVRRSRTMAALPSLIEEDVAEDIERCLAFASGALDLLDTSSTIQSVADPRRAAGQSTLDVNEHLGARPRDRAAGPTVPKGRPALPSPRDCAGLDGSTGEVASWALRRYCNWRSIVRAGDESAKHAPWSTPMTRGLR